MILIMNTKVILIYSFIVFFLDKKLKLTPAEKMKRYRENLKTKPGKLITMKQKDAARKRLSRQLEKMKEFAMTEREQTKVAERRKMIERDRKRNWRWRLSRADTVQDIKYEEHDESDDQVTPTKVYCSKQAAGKALQRLRVRLPFSPRKRKALTLKLALEAGNALETSKIIRKGVDSETEEKVLRFYSRDDISWAAPGKRDSKVVENSSGEKEVQQKRYLTMNVMEAHQLFKIENLDVKIGKSKFFEFRPKHIQPMSDIPHNVCICKLHGNIDSLLQGISKVYSQSPRTGRELIASLVCQRDNPSCMMNTCTECSNIQFALDSDKQDCEDSVKWRKWTESEGRPVQGNVLMSLEDAVDEVNGMFNDYKCHCLVKDQQSKLFKECKENILEKEAVIQIDFAENYAAVTQDEVQSAHWNHTQITIFTAVAWFQNGCKSFVVISDDLNHDKVTVWAMLGAIVRYLKTEHSITHIKLFSDGCAAQFKNRYTQMNLCFMEQDYGVTGTWAFFASSHGKGSVDAVGGTVKRNVWRIVKSRREIVNDATTFHKVTLISSLF